MPICEICESKLKNPRSASHIRTKKHQTALKKLGKGSIVTTQTSVKRSVPTATFQVSGIEHRVKLLEDRVKFIMTKLDAIDVKLTDLRPTRKNLPGSSSIKMQIKQLVSPGESVTIDTLVNSKELRHIKWNILERTLIDLVDDEIFDVSEGKSRKKIAGNIGRLIRR